MKLEEKEEKAISGGDILKLLNGKTRVIKYSELAKINNINELLFGYDSCVILILSKQNYGHWVCITRRDNILEFFDSYGFFIDDDEYFKRTSKYCRKMFGQDYPHLTYLFLTADPEYKITYNEIRFQKMSPYVSTCGRHVICRIIYKNMDLYDYYNFLKSIDNDLDKVVTLLTHKI